MANALYSIKERVKNSLAGIRAQPKNALIDATRGALLGATTDAIGYLPDAVADFMRPFGYNVAPENVVGGTQWLANRFTQPTNSLAENAARFTTGMLTPSPMDFARAGKPIMNEMIVYHGSPHRINNVDAEHPMGRFDTSKIGTGEGAQAYGHGIYLAESPDVAKSYAPRDFDYEDRLMDLYKRAEMRNDTDTMEVLESAMMHSTPTELRAQYPQAKIVDQIEKLNAQRKSGHFYTVDLPDEHIANMLDWDAPLSQQPGIARALAPLLANKRNAPAIENFASGGALYNYLASHDPLTGAMTPRAEVSAMMKAAGIPGIRYLDGGSRSAGNGTRNFVIFDGDTAKILKRE